MFNDQGAHGAAAATPFPPSSSSSSSLRLPLPLLGGHFTWSCTQESSPVSSLRTSTRQANPRIVQPQGQSQSRVASSAPTKRDVISGGDRSLLLRGSRLFLYNLCVGAPRVITPSGGCSCYVPTPPGVTTSPFLALSLPPSPGCSAQLHSNAGRPQRAAAGHGRRERAARARTRARQPRPRECSGHGREKGHRG